MEIMSTFRLWPLNLPWINKHCVILHVQPLHSANTVLILWLLGSIKAPWRVLTHLTLRLDPDPAALQDIKEFVWQTVISSC